MRELPKGTKQRVIYQLRAAGIRGDTPNSQRSGTHYRGYLPHVKKEGTSYFVTFRLGDSLPQAVLRKLQFERDERLGRLQTGGTADCKSALQLRQDVERDYRREIERFLDKGVGNCWMKRPEIAEIVANALRFFDGQRYVLGSWVVMPNHVHAVIWPMPNFLLGDILRSLKRYAAREANKILDRTGEKFWQPESFDHWIRDDEEKARIVRYIENNPVKAGLCKTASDWKWCSVSGGKKGRLQTGDTAD